MMNEKLAAILESADIAISPVDDLISSFENWLGLHDTYYDGLTVEDCAPLKRETFQLIINWLKEVWDSKDSLITANVFVESGLTPKEISLDKAVNSVRATRWMAYWMELSIDNQGDNIQDDSTKRDIFVHLLEVDDAGLITALFHYIQNLPTLQSQMHMYTQQLQKRKTSTTTSARETTELADPQARLKQYALAQNVAQRFQIEWDQHISDLEKILGQVYLVANAHQRKLCRRLLGHVWSQYINSAGAAGLRQENTRAAGIRLTLQVLYRILLGVETIEVSHEHLLSQHLIPLHKPDAMVLWRDQISVLELYHEPLVKCIAIILQKKQSLVPQAILELVNAEVFPLVGNTPKQVLLLHEVDTYLGLLGDEKCCTATWWSTFLAVLKRSITSDHSRVAERALEFFKNKSFKKLISQRLLFTLEILLPALVRQQPSWNPTVRKMTYHILKNLREENEDSFREVSNRLFSEMTLIGMEQCEEKPERVAVSGILATGPDHSMLLDTSLKAGMGSWKPPPVSSGRGMPPPPSRVGGQPGRGQAPWANGAAQPPATLTGVAPWASSSTTNPPSTVTGVAPWATTRTSTKQSPVTITGVAPWAMKPALPPVGTTLKHKQPSPQSALATFADDEPEEFRYASPESGFEYVIQYMEKITPPVEETGASSWSKSQMAETPTLLPDLKFHDLVFGHDLGSGAFGSVKYARLIDKTKTRSYWPEYAVKIISTEKIRQLGYEASVQREIAVLRLLSHPGIARLVSSFRFKDGAYLVLEYASRGDLHTLLRKHGSLDHQSTRFVVGSVVAAIASIHDFGMVYGDLKTENVLITEAGHIKITDFGGCRPVTPAAKAMVRSVANNLLNSLRDGDWKTKRGVNSMDDSNSVISNDMEEDEDDRIEGTISCLPPEVVMGAVPTTHADSWALGCLMYQCLSGRPPFIEPDDEATRRTIVSFHSHEETTGRDSVNQLFEDKHASTIQENARIMIKACLKRDVSMRPDMEALARFDFFTKEEVDVFSLHSQPAHPLDVGNVSPAPDAQWSRRQFSSIWAPQPVAYDISLPDLTQSSASFALTNTSPPIKEGEEARTYFSLTGEAPRPLGKISERLPPGV